VKLLSAFTHWILFAFETRKSDLSLLKVVIDAVTAKVPVLQVEIASVCTLTRVVGSKLRVVEPSAEIVNEVTDVLVARLERHGVTDGDTVTGNEEITGKV